MSGAADGILDKFRRKEGRRADNPPRVMAGGGTLTTGDACSVVSGMGTGTGVSSDSANDGRLPGSLTGDVVVILRSDVYGCRQTGQNQPLAFLFLLGATAGVPTAVAVVPAEVMAIAKALPMVLVKGCVAASGVV